MSNFNIKLKPEHLNISTFRVAQRGGFDTSNETGVVIIHRPTGLKAECSNKRSAHANRASALALLTEMIRVRLYPYKHGRFPPLLWHELKVPPIHVLPSVEISNFLDAVSGKDGLKKRCLILDYVPLPASHYIQQVGRAFRVTSYDKMEEALAHAGKLLTKYQKASHVYFLNTAWYCEPCQGNRVKVGDERE